MKNFVLRNTVQRRKFKHEKKNILQMICSKTEKKEHFFAKKRTFEKLKKILQTLCTKTEKTLF